MGADNVNRLLGFPRFCSGSNTDRSCLEAKNAQKKQDHAQRSAGHGCIVRVLISGAQAVFSSNGE